jgi:hypothetical protein
MPRLTEVQRGQAIALLIQGQRQQQVALQFGVNVFTIERLGGMTRCVDELVIIILHVLFAFYHFLYGT